MRGRILGTEHSLAQEAKRGYAVNPAGVLAAVLVLFWGTVALLLWRLL
jgi:hypothetical protein